jgi:2-iminobutanoate/2-iminopropanoate deaminase
MHYRLVFPCCLLLFLLTPACTGDKTENVSQQAESKIQTNMKKIISTTEAPAAIGPYSQAVEVNGMLFVSGQIPMDPGTSEIVAGEIAVQTERVIQNLEAILKTAGYTLNDVVKTTCYLTSMNDFQQFNEVYARYFTQKPARATVEVSRLPRGAKVEVEAIAVKGEEEGKR